MAAAKKTPRAANGADSNGSADAATVEEAPEQAAPNAVLILRDVDEGGNVGVQVQTLGDVSITEVQTVIELGLSRFREQVGLGAAKQ